MIKNDHKILGISFDADENQIEQAYRQNAINYHLDKNPKNTIFNEKFIEINEANIILIDAEKRKEYNIKYKIEFCQMCILKHKIICSSVGRYPP